MAFSFSDLSTLLAAAKAIGPRAPLLLALAGDLPEIIAVIKEAEADFTAPDFDPTAFLNALEAALAAAHAKGAASVVPAALPQGGPEPEAPAVEEPQP